MFSEFEVYKWNLIVKAANITESKMWYLVNVAGYETSYI